MEHFIEPTIPKSDYKKRWSDIEGFTAEYIRSAFPRYFIEKKVFEHKCESCGGRMEVFNDFSNAFCPVCGVKMVENGEGLWD